MSITIDFGEINEYISDGSKLVLDLSLVKGRTRTSIIAGIKNRAISSAPKHTNKAFSVYAKVCAYVGLPANFSSRNGQHRFHACTNEMVEFVKAAAIMNDGHPYFWGETMSGIYLPYEFMCAAYNKYCPPTEREKELRERAIALIEGNYSLEFTIRGADK